MEEAAQVVVQPALLSIFISIIGVIVAVVLAVITVKISDKRVREQLLADQERFKEQILNEQTRFLFENNKAEIQRAVDLAGVFASDIVSPASYISTCYDKKEIFGIAKKTLNTKRKEGDLSFTVIEVKALFKTPGIAEKVKLALSPNEMLCSSFYGGEMIFPTGLTEAQRKLLLNNADKKISELEDTHLSNICCSNYRSIKVKLLNRLEAFAMNFSTELADSKTVYQSLHQLYLSTVLLMYFDIALKNTDPKDYYYTNIISLFNMWNNEYNLQMKEEEDLRKKHEDDNEGISRRTRGYKEQ